ncbi:Crossover junction endonuclease mus81 [Saitoella coloradoensis]
MPPKAQSVCGNPLYLEWIGEWMENARALNSKGYQTMRKAYDSMKNCPIPFQHPSQAITLKGIGPTICDRLEKKLREHCAKEGIPMPEKPGVGAAGNQADGSGEEDAAPKKRKTTRPYVPTYRSGPYALLLALHTHSLTSPLALLKSEIIPLAQPHCDSSFEAPPATNGGNKFYTAWNSMKTLVDRGLVYRNGSPGRYLLTEEGEEVAGRIAGVADETEGGGGGNIKKARVEKEGSMIRLPEVFAPPASVAPTAAAAGPRPAARAHRDDVVILDDDEDTPIIVEDLTIEPAIVAAPSPAAPAPLLTTGSAATTFPSFTPIILPPGSFTIHLLLDTREAKTQRDRDYMEQNLNVPGVNLMLRSLEISDALWIARCKHTGREIVLGYGIERKRMDDLVGSIKDGRFHEQKFRLMKSGLRHVMYVIEESHLDDVRSYLEAIQTAISSTQVVNGFFVKRVPNLEGTVSYLARMSKMLGRIYEGKALHVIPDNVIDARTFGDIRNHLKETQPNIDYLVSYTSFSALTSKSAALTLGDVYLRMLMTIRGVSAEKAVEIATKFPTPTALMEGYEKCKTVQEQKRMIMEKCCGYGRKKIGGALSEKVWRVWMEKREQQH